MYEALCLDGPAKGTIVKSKYHRFNHGSILHVDYGEKYVDPANETITEYRLITWRNSTAEYTFWVSSVECPCPIGAMLEIIKENM